MDLNFTPEEEAFRDEVRAFLAEKLPTRLSDKVRSGKHLRQGRHGGMARHPQRARLARQPLARSSTAAPAGTRCEKFIFENECALAHAPRIVPFGVNMLGPVLIKYGNEAQKRHWLPRILDGSDWWCQGYSEPGAGSDLASVKTHGRARHRRPGRPLHRQRPEDLDHAGPARQHDLLPGAHQPRGQEAGGHQLPADRHEVAGRRGAADHHARRRARGQRSVLHRRARAGREPGRRGEQGLDLRQVPADLRAHQHRGRRLLGGRAGAAQGRSPRSRRRTASRWPKTRPSRRAWRASRSTWRT